MAIDEDFDAEDDENIYVCKESGITGMELDCFVAFDECDNRSAYGVEELIRKYGEGDEARMRKFIYSHLVHCKACETEYSWLTFYSELTRIKKANIASAQEDGIPLKDILNAMGVEPETAEGLAKQKKNSGN